MNTTTTTSLKIEGLLILAIHTTTEVDLVSKCIQAGIGDHIQDFGFMNPSISIKSIHGNTIGGISIIGMDGMLGDIPVGVNMSDILT
jgi:hypothetical protein